MGMHMSQEAMTLPISQAHPYIDKILFHCLIESIHRQETIYFKLLSLLHSPLYPSRFSSTCPPSRSVCAPVNELFGTSTGEIW
jgi:hypothetical protein